MKNTIAVFADNSLYGKAAQAHAKILSEIFNADVHTIDVHEIENPICFVMPVGDSKTHTFFNPKSAGKWIQKSKAPVLTVGSFEPKKNDYQQIVLPLDINCQEKELALWASYFPDNFHKHCPQIPKDHIFIHIIFNEYENISLRAKVQHNIDYAVKLFNNLGVFYQLHPFSKVDNIHTFGLKFAEKTGNCVLLYLIPQHYSIVDFLFGPVSNSILGNKEQVPVLCLNARADILVLCR